jgi:AcrR family transcriptional regulator
MAQLLEVADAIGEAECNDGDPQPYLLPKATDLEQRRRWTRDDWVVYGLLTLERGGLSAVRIEEMARRSGRTPGSFYGYFANRDALLEAMVVTWKRFRISQLEWTHRHLKRTGRYTLSGVIEDFLVRGKGEWARPDLDMAMRIWARHEPRAREALYEIDESRLVNATAMVRAEQPGASNAVEIAVLLNWVLNGRHILFIDPANQATSRAAGRALGHLVKLAMSTPASGPMPSKTPMRKRGAAVERPARKAPTAAANSRRTRSA